jgi:hypothetical protein
VFVVWTLTVGTGSYKIPLAAALPSVTGGPGSDFKLAAHAALSRCPDQQSGICLKSYKRGASRHFPREATDPDLILAVRVGSGDLAGPAFLRDRLR